MFLCANLNRERPPTILSAALFLRNARSGEVDLVLVEKLPEIS